jgi:hypothetical protein
LEKSTGDKPMVIHSVNSLFLIRFSRASQGRDIQGAPIAAGAPGLEGDLCAETEVQLGGKVSARICGGDEAEVATIEVGIQG